MTLTLWPYLQDDLQGFTPISIPISPTKNSLHKMPISISQV